VRGQQGDRSMPDDPVAIGINLAAGFFASIHAHYGTGTIHLESPRETPAVRRQALLASPYCPWGESSWHWALPPGC
jgi:hypothetical protein